MERNENQFTLRGALIAGLLVLTAAAVGLSMLGSDAGTAKADTAAPTAASSKAAGTGTTGSAAQNASGAATNGAATTPGTAGPSTTAATAPPSPGGSSTTPPLPPPPKLGTSDSEARENALAVVTQVEACHINGLTYQQCTTQQTLGSTVPISNNAGPGEVTVVAVANGYVVSSIDAVRRQWRLSKRATSFTRTCHMADGITPCSTPTW